MFHYHALIARKTDLEVPPVRSYRMRFFNPALDKWTARLDLRHYFVPNLVNIGCRIIRFAAGVGGTGAAVSDRGFRIAARTLRSYGFAIAQCIQTLDHFIKRRLLEGLDRANDCHLEM